MSARQSFARVIRARAHADPDSTVVISDHEGTRLNAAELDAMSNKLAREYRARGVTRNSLVTVALPNSTEFVVVCAAIWKAGATPNPVSPNLPERERAALEALARPALVIGKPPVNPGIPHLPAGYVSGADAAALPDAWADSWKAPASSGSTGTPKIVMATAPALIDPDRAVAPFLPREATQLIAAPLWHSAQFTYAFRGLLTGHRIVLTERFDEHRFARQVEEYQITWTMLSPNDIHRLVGRRHDADVGCLQTLLHIGAPCSPSDKRALIDWLGPTTVVEVYAGSESNGLTMITGQEWLAKPGSVGKPLGNTEIQIRMENGTRAAAGTIGEVWMRRGDHPTYRYRGATSRRTTDGWDSLGDLGYLDEDNYLFIADRAADVMVRNGTPVYPSRVEHVLLRHPGVCDAVVFATADGEVGAVIETADTALDTDALLDAARPHLTSDELPSHITFAHAPLRSSAGKVRRSTFRSSQPSISTV